MQRQSPNLHLQRVIKLVHSSDELVDECLSVAMVPSLDIMPGLLSVSTTSIAQLEWPQKVVGLFEMWAHCHNLMDEVLYTDDAILPQ